MSPELDPLSQALADAIQLRRDANADTQVLQALHGIVGHCRTQLGTLQGAAIAEAEQATQWYERARSTGDRVQVEEAYRHSQDAVAHAARVTAEVDAALKDLLAGAMELTSPALERLQQVVDVTQALIAEAERRWPPPA